MKTFVAAIALLMVGWGSCQEDLAKKPIQIQGIETGATREAREIVEVLYRSATIRDQCLKTPDAKLDVALNGYKVPLDCSLFIIWYQRARELAQQ